MIKSMTAFARADDSDGPFAVSAEVRSYNSRYLDIALRLPHGYQDLEEKIKALISEKVARGRVEIKVQIVDASEDAYAFDINMPKARAYFEALVRLKTHFDVGGEVSLDHLTGPGGIVTPAETQKDLAVCWPVVRKCLEDAMDRLVEMRGREGEIIAEDFYARLEYIRGSLDFIEKESANLLELYRERLKERMTALTKGLIEIDPVRIAQEAAFFADRSDISEELVRVQSHLEHFHKILKAAEPGGRKLNFLLQELNREFNTMGSKTENVAVSHRIVEVKGELERIREQVQNVE